MQFPWRWDSGTIPLNLGAIWGMSVKIHHYKGQGIAQDYAEAVKWLRLAVEQGYATAQHALGIKVVSHWSLSRNVQ